MAEDVIVPPLLQKAEVLLVLLVVLVASLTWAFWELFSFVNRESEDNDDWWEELKNCHHRRLIIPVGAPLRAYALQLYQMRSCQSRACFLIFYTLSVVSYSPSVRSRLSSLEHCLV